MGFEEQLRRIEERHESLAQALELYIRIQAEAQKTHAESHADMEKRHADTERRVGELDRLARRTEATLRRAIALSVREARNERKRRNEMFRELDEKITQLAAAQLLTQEALRQFLASQQRTNGHES
jgi:hypothetical protein